MNKIKNMPIGELSVKMPVTVGMESSVKVAREIMTKHRCHHLPVLDGGKLVGFVSDRDLKLFEASGSFEEPISEVMSEDVILMKSTAKISEVIEKMLERHAGSVLVDYGAGQPIGIFTTTDALKFLWAELK